MTGANDGKGADSEVAVGLIDGSQPATTRRFRVVLSDDAVVQLDDLLACRQQLPDGRDVWHYGIVVEGRGEIEGAEMASDTHRITAAGTMPGITSRQVEVQVLRTVPELWLPPEPGAATLRAKGEHRDSALFLDQMEEGKRLPAGVDQSGEPVFVDFTFVNGEKGGHVSISGVSGVATKTSYALFLLYLLFETDPGRSMLGAHAPNTRALVFNVKGEDLLHLDRSNNRFAAREDAAGQWERLGVPAPGAFQNVALFAPKIPGLHGNVVTSVVSRATEEVTAFGWPPADFIREGLLRFCFAEDEDQRTQVPFIEQRVRVQLARWAYPLEHEPGAVVLCEPPAGTSFVFDRIIREKRQPKRAGDGVPIRTFDDLIDFLSQVASPDDTQADPDWTANTAAGTRSAFLRRLFAQGPRLGHLMSVGLSPVRLEKSVSVVDIHSLHDSAQRFVVGALLSRVFEEKQGSGREPLRFIVLDELNKYAPRTGSSPIKDVLVDIAARGRSLGVILIGAQQSAGDVDGNVIRNASVKVVGRLDAGEADEYRFLSPEVRERASRFLPGTMVIDQPLIPAPLPVRFPFPAFATCVAESQPPPRTDDEEKAMFEALR